MLLDHASLEPFEPLIGEAFDRAFGEASRGLTEAGLSPGDEWHTEAARFYRAACLPSFKTAQNAIGTTVLALEKQIGLLEADERKARCKRNASTADQLKELRNVLQNRQLVMRRLLDGMLWVLVWPNKWILRRLRLERGIRRVNPATVECRVVFKTGQNGGV